MNMTIDEAIREMEFLIDNYTQMMKDNDIFRKSCERMKAACELSVEALRQMQSGIKDRDCEHCEHYKDIEIGIGIDQHTAKCCERWECEFKPIEE